MQRSWALRLTKSKVLWHDKHDLMQSYPHFCADDADYHIVELSGGHTRPISCH